MIYTWFTKEQKLMKRMYLLKTNKVKRKEEINNK